MTTLETRRPTRPDPKPNSVASGGAPTPYPTNVRAKPNDPSSGGDPNVTTGQPVTDTQSDCASRGPISHPTITSPEPRNSASGGASVHSANGIPTPMLGAPDAATLGRTATGSAEPIERSLFDPALALAADILDDVEKVWVANQNRLRILTTPSDQPDKDGQCRGFGLTDDHPDVARLADMVAVLETLTDNATKHLEKVMRRHPLHPWIKAQKGLGDKQVARLLAAIGDPYIRPELTREDGTVEPSRPRTVSELRAYAGYHVVPAGQASLATHSITAGRGSAGRGDTSHGMSEAHGQSAGVAPRRQRSRKSNWNETARKRAWLVAKSIVKQRCTPCKNADGVHVAECTCSPYRVLYDATKAKYAGAVHKAPCVLCGSKGKPAEVGIPLKPGHIDARGLRAVSKAVLEDLWLEARHLHNVAGEGAP